jgi:tetratricopeptide (TPR) repeat protein
MASLYNFVMPNDTKIDSEDNKPEIFVSYSHLDESWKNMLQPHLEVLRRFGGISYWDDRQIGTGEDWYPQIKENMENAKAAVCLISVNYLASDFIQKEEVPYLLEKRKKEGMLFIPILVDECPWKMVPWLNGIQMIPRDGRSLVKGYKGNENEVFTEVVDLIQEHVGKVKAKVLEEVFVEVISDWNPPGKIDIDRLPVTGAELFGRTGVLNQLNDFWESETKNVVSFVAWGGVGKSTLINKWLQYMSEDNYRGAKKVFGWSFYSQGTNEKVTSADRFIREALEWFGDDNPDEGSVWDKGKRLGKLIGEGKNLLILDGMEPLQSRHDFERGKIKDPALEMLLKQLAKKNDGLCVITTREEISGMERFKDGIKQIQLEQISKEAGRALLRVQGVRGTDAELETAVDDFGNHALAINLLGSYLHEISGHHVSEANKIENIKVDNEKERHPRRVIQAWEKKLGEGSELNILRIMGLFDRPADEGAVKALRKKPVIKNLNDTIKSENKFLEALKKLRKFNLIAEENHAESGNLDAHPIVRQHFAEQLKLDYPKTWRKSNNRLYQYYKNIPNEFPDTVEEMQPLFFATAHACAAGKHLEVFKDIYWKRILRGEKCFVTHNLGAYGANLAFLALFFEEKWSRLIRSFRKLDYGLIFNLVGFNLRSLGRMREAVETFGIALEIRLSLNNWKYAAVEACNFSEIYLSIGEMKQAIYFGEKGVEYADQSYDEFMKMSLRTTLAFVKFQSGQINEAEKLFIKAEKMQKERQTEYPLLYALAGFWYCVFLLDKKQIKEAIRRADYAIKLSEKWKSLLQISLDKLTFGRAYFLQALLEKETGFDQSTEFLNQAVDDLRKAGALDFLPFGLLARAELCRVQEKWNEAQEDLDEAFDLSISSEMRLHECDAHLEQARLFLAQEKKDEAIPHVEQAAKLIEDIGYHRRDSALKELQEQVK